MAKNQSFLRGAAVLAAATAIVKIIGALYKIPLGRILDDAGFSYFNTAYDFYSVLLTISTAGLPVAMSRMISEAQTLGNGAQIKRIYKSSLTVFLIIGVLGSCAMFFLAKPMAAGIGSPSTWYSIAALAPAVFFVCLMSSFRGYFQGQSNMTPTAVSQILEALCKLVVGLGAAYLILSAGYPMGMASGGAILGVTVGTALGSLYLFFNYRKNDRELSATASKPSKSFNATMYELLAIAIPITIGAAGLQLINLIDSGVLLTRLQDAAGFTELESESLKGIYDKARTLFNLPAAFIVPVTVSVIPTITAALTLKDAAKARRIETSAIRLTALLALPCGAGLAVLSGPIQRMLYDYNDVQTATATPLLALLGCAVIFNCFVLITNAILQAHGKVSIPVYNMLIGGVVKLVINYILIGIPGIAIVGAPIGSLTCYVVIAGLNLLAIRRVLPEKLPVIRVFGKPLFATAVMSVITFIVYDVLSSLLSSGSLSCLISIGIAGIVYIILVYVLRIITYDDCLLLAKGEKIAKLLNVRRNF